LAGFWSNLEDRKDKDVDVREAAAKALKEVQQKE